MERGKLQYKKKCLILDTNIWVYNTSLLRTPLGASLLYYIKMGDIKIGPPEVVELEINKHSLKVVKEAIQNIVKGYEQIEAFLGERDDYFIPSEEQINKVIENRLESLRNLFFRIPLTLDQTKRAITKVINEVPPNTPKNQQFKDSCIWGNFRIIQ
jgi:PIN domain